MHPRHFLPGEVRRVCVGTAVTPTGSRVARVDLDLELKVPGACRVGAVYEEVVFLWRFNDL